MARVLLTAMVAVGLSGCVMGIPDAYTPPKVKTCDKIVVVYPERRAVCMTREEFDKWVKQNL